ncbi:MAG: hypothetical protein L0G23_07620 [Ruaniaceae bacterium]|nr:hypothetical protein [Ruaniaceae bacterium]
MNPMFRFLIRSAPVIIVAARQAWPHIARTLEQNPQLAVGAKDAIASYSGRHRKATVEELETRIAALRAHALTMPQSTNAAAVYGTAGITPAEAIQRLDLIDSSVHSLAALSPDAQPGALRKISYELDRLAAQVLLPKG